jgi:AmmeMemoRadiSam system protein A
MATDERGTLSTEERRILLRLARQAIAAAAEGESAPRVNLEEMPPALRAPAACFVTLQKGDELRGCTGTLAAQAPLAAEVVRTAAQTALYDPRFPSVTPEEVPDIEIEISILTEPQRLTFSDPRDLQHLLRPGIDGVTLRRDIHRATFLPQVWEHIPEPTRFLDMLCQKMGLPTRSWTQPGMIVETYQVEKFTEAELQDAGS